MKPAKTLPEEMANVYEEIETMQKAGCTHTVFGKSDLNFPNLVIRDLNRAGVHAHWNESVFEDRSDMIIVHHKNIR